MRKTVLVVEDESMLREATTIVLKLNGYDVDAATNGKEALDMCSRKTYDIILLDLMMPIMDGVAFLANADLANTAPDTRIVLLSNLSSGESIAEAEALGVHRREIKANLSPKELVEVVEAELKMRDRAAKRSA